MNEGYYVEKDYDNDWCLDMYIALLHDDKESMMSLRSSPHAWQGGLWYVLPKLWDKICGNDSVNCATAVLENDLDQIADINKPGIRGAFLLHQAANRLAPRVIQLLLDHGARTDIRLYDERDMEEHSGVIRINTTRKRDVEELKGMLPLTIAVEGARQMLCWDNAYSPGRPTFQLIVSLCLPRMRRALEACKLLAMSSVDVEKEAYYYGMEGKFIELAVLLIVARKKVFVPLTLCGSDGAGISGRMTILQCLRNRIQSLVQEEMKLRTKFEHGKVLQIQSKIKALSKTALLLEVFVRAGDTIEEYLPGDTIEEYLQSQPHHVLREQVEKDVALRVAEKGVILKDGDFDLSTRNCVNSWKSFGTHAKYLNHLSDKLPPFSGPHLPLLQEKNVSLPPRKEEPHYGHRLSNPCLVTHYPFKNMKSTHTDLVSKSSGAGYFTTVDIPVKKQTKPISREILQKIALSIKRGI